MFLVCCACWCSGQLGLGDNFIAKQQTPQHVLSLSKVKVTQMACGQDHTAVLTSELNIIFSYEWRLVAANNLTLTSNVFHESRG